VHIGDTLTADVPPEPPKMSVVMDRQRRAWQRLDGMFGHEWIRTTTPHMAIAPTEATHMAWASLLVAHGPLHLVYLPPTEDGVSPDE